MKNDFFARFRKTNHHHIIVPVFLALGISIFTVAQMQGTVIDMRTLSANVAGGLEERVSYPADLMVEKGTDNTLTLRIGKDAESVKTLSFTVIGDPNVFVNMASTDSATRIDMTTPGIALVRVRMDRALRAGDIVTTLTPTLSGVTPLTVIDALFVSESETYSLSVKGD